MTVTNADRESLRHGKITEQPLREKPGYPTWAIKLVMAVTGLIFALFVIGHMAGNLKLYLPAHDGVAALDEYGAFLRSMGEPLFPHESILWVIRIVLLIALIAHIHGAITLISRSGKSRGKFRRTNLMGGLDSAATRSMIVTGVIILLFLLFHLADLTLGLAPAAPESFEHGAVHANMIATFSRWPVVLLYVIANLALFLHLFHGITLAASDLGITGRKWRAVFSWLAALVPLIVVAGNIIMPLSILFGWVS